MATDTAPTVVTKAPVVAPTDVKATIAPKGDINISTPTTTYNPRERSFIKAPEKKVCPHCGQMMTPDIKPMKNAMSNYVNPATGLVMVLNDDAQEVQVSGVTLYRVTGYNKDGRAISEYAPALKA